MMKKRHVNIPIFIPHEGCPNACVFCNQRTITGEGGSADRDIRPEIDECLSSIDKDTCECEIAFFGGSFTGIDRGAMIRLLSAAKEYIDRGLVSSVRLSTRPDYIDEEILGILEEYGVKHIELGIQSMDDGVLASSRRGHDAECTRRACRRITERGFSLTGQMMIGLPGSSQVTEIETAKEICALGAESARIYPTVVFCDTELCAMAKRGEYVPITNEEATERSAAVYKIFAEHGVTLLRIGLVANEGLRSENVFAGASHSAIGEMAVGLFYYDLLCEKCRKAIENGEIRPGVTYRLTIFCAPGEVSKVSGQKRVNKEKITAFLSGLGLNVRYIKVKEKESVLKNGLALFFERMPVYAEEREITANHENRK